MLTGADESRHERFQRVAEARTNKIIDMLRLLGNCSNRTNYEYSEDEVQQIFEALEQEMEEARSRFVFSGENGPRFSLRSRR